MAWIVAVVCILWMGFAIYLTVDVGQGAHRYTVGDLVADSRRDRGSYSQWSDLHSHRI